MIILLSYIDDCFHFIFTVTVEWNLLLLGVYRGVPTQNYRGSVVLCPTESVPLSAYHVSQLFPRYGKLKSYFPNGAIMVVNMT